MERFTTEDLDYLKLIFVTREECSSITDELKRDVNTNFTDLEVIKFQNKLILGILSAVGLAVLSLVVGQFWGV